MNNNTINKLTSYRIFYNWSNGDYQTFVDDLTATGHFTQKDVVDLVQNTEAIATYWVENFPFFISINLGRCCLEIQNQVWAEPFDNLWKLEKELASFLISENYKL